jgi:hypothetical protein
VGRGPLYAASAPPTGSHDPGPLSKRAAAGPNAPGSANSGSSATTTTTTTPSPASSNSSASTTPNSTSSGSGSGSGQSTAAMTTASTSPPKAAVPVAGAHKQRPSGWNDAHRKRRTYYGRHGAIYCGGGLTRGRAGGWGMATQRRSRQRVSCLSLAASPWTPGTFPLQTSVTQGRVYKPFFLKSHLVWWAGRVHGSIGRWRSGGAM